MRTEGDTRVRVGEEKHTRERGRVRREDLRALNGDGGALREGRMREHWIPPYSHYKNSIDT